MSDLNGKVAIVTGASVGLGKSMAIALAGAGARVVLASPQTALLQEVAQQINAAQGQGRALAVTTDITQRDQCDACVKQTLEAFGAIDILVNNARREQRGPGLPPAATACRSGSPIRMSGFSRSTSMLAAPS